MKLVTTLVTTVGMERSPSPTPLEAPCETPTVTVAPNIEFGSMWTAEAPPKMFGFANVCLGDFCPVKKRIHLGDTTCDEIDIALWQVMHTLGCHYIP
jgi:hypothetical protein